MFSLLAEFDKAFLRNYNWNQIFSTFPIIYDKKRRRVSPSEALKWKCSLGILFVEIYTIFLGVQAFRFRKRKDAQETAALDQCIFLFYPTFLAAMLMEYFKSNSEGLCGLYNHNLEFIRMVYGEW